MWYGRDAPAAEVLATWLAARYICPWTCAQCTRACCLALCMQAPAGAPLDLLSLDPRSRRGCGGMRGWRARFVLALVHPRGRGDVAGQGKHGTDQFCSETFFHYAVAGVVI
jgi:hypothetical protein